MFGSELDISTPPVDALTSVERIAEGGREREGFVGLDRNERLSPLPPWLIDELRAAIDSAMLTGYPVLDDLYADLTQLLGLARERLLLTPGSDAVFRAVHHAYARPGDRIVMLDPSYAMYPIYARMFGAEPLQVPFAEDLSLDPETLLAAITSSVRMVLLANPNQPTGTSLPDEVLHAAVAKTRDSGALIVVDEAYFPFSRSTVIAWLLEHPHLVVTRTFSKAWGLAGARVGFAAAHPELIDNLYKVRSAYDVNAFAATCARTLLAHPEVAADYVAEVDAGRQVVTRESRRLGLEPLPGETNFQLIRVEPRIEPAELVERLRERGYLIRGPFNAPCLRGCVRVTLGPPKLMERFCHVLEEVLEGS